MSITAVVEKGMIQLPSDVLWVSDTVVRSELLEDHIPTLLETFNDFEGMAGDLVPDLAANLDLNLHGRSNAKNDVEISA